MFTLGEYEVKFENLDDVQIHSKYPDPLVPIGAQLM